jgi:hypothetical protein
MPGRARRTGHVCPVCGTVYDDEERAARCAAVRAEPEEIAPGTLVEVRGAAPATGPGLIARSFLLGLDDPRGEAHTRFYRANFLWGRADLRAADLIARGPATEAEWRAAVEVWGAR